MNFNVKSLAFERLVAEMLKKDNPNIVINNLDHERNFSNKIPIFDAYIFESLDLRSFALDVIKDKILRCLKVGLYEDEFKPIFKDYIISGYDEIIFDSEEIKLI